VQVGRHSELAKEYEHRNEDEDEEEEATVKP
jgi:hypothetical protein